MDIITVFTPTRNPVEELGLLSIEYDGEECCVFDKLFDHWENAEYMTRFCQENLPDVYIKFGYAIDPEEAARELMDEADDLREMLVQFARGESRSGTLQHLFQRLSRNPTSKEYTT